MIKTNKVKASIHGGQKVYGFLLPFPCASIVEIMGHLGFDFVMVDAEHGPFTTESAEEMFRAADSVGLTPLVRVPDHEFSTILRSPSLWGSQVRPIIPRCGRPYSRRRSGSRRQAR